MYHTTDAYKDETINLLMKETVNSMRSQRS